MAADSLRAELAHWLSRYDIRPSKRLGQTFMIDSSILNREVEAVAPKGRWVLEIGPGPGFLTERLAADAKNVIAVEKDGRFVAMLGERLGHLKNLEVVHADFLEWRPPALGIVASNLPYSIASPALFKLAGCYFDRGLLCLQSEFAQRLVARPGDRDRSRLSVMAQVAFEIELLDAVPRTAFWPVPAVDSQLVCLQPTGGQLSEWQSAVITALFQHPNQNARKALSHSPQLKLAKTTIEAVPHAQKRARTLTIDELLEISGALR